MTDHPQLAIEYFILSVVEQSHSCVAMAALLTAVQGRVPEATRTQVRAAVKSMVVSGLLAYAEKCGTSCLVVGHNVSARVSERIFLTPGRLPDPQVAGAVVIRLTSGASFGMGDHPTTRMALRGLDCLAMCLAKDLRIETANALDIGTGTGVLAIAAAKLGFKHVVAVDIDAVACYEALLNATANNVQQVLEIVFGTLEALTTRRFDVILANLRPPTLVALAPKMIEMTNPGGFWIISGFRDHERPALLSALPQRCRELQVETDKAWCASVCQLYPSAGA